MYYTYLCPFHSRLDKTRNATKKNKNLVLDVTRTLGTSNPIIFYNLRNILFVNRFRFTKINVTKDRRSKPMDTTVKLGSLKFSLRATIDHHGPSIHLGHYTASVNCSKTFYCYNNKIVKFEITDSINSSAADVILYELIDLWVLNSNKRLTLWLLPWLWHILSILLITGRGISAETCGLDYVFPTDDPCSHPETLIIYIHIYVCILYTGSGYRT